MSWLADKRAVAIPLITDRRQTVCAAVKGQSRHFVMRKNSEPFLRGTTRIFMTVWSSSGELRINQTDAAKDCGSLGYCRRRLFAEALSAPCSLPHAGAGLARRLTAPRPAAVGRRQPPLANRVRTAG